MAGLSSLTPACLLGPRQQARGYLPGGRETPQEEPQHPRGPRLSSGPAVAHGRPAWPWSAPCPLGLSVPTCP